jgi:NhaA family Na+:H+ antiporter
MMNIITKFFTSKLAPGILLIVATILALVMENTSLYLLYDTIKDTPVMLQIGAFKIDKPLLLWINDGLMAVFFLLVGLEVKREILKGHLSKREQLTLPVIAALGGVIFPSLIYLFFNYESPDTISGWAIPAATDIAFALGILTLLGNRVPSTLKICLVAIAIIDDLAAIIIIALFYTADTSITSLGLAGLGLLAAYILNKKGVTKLGPYAMLGFFIWACVLKSGIHATLAGVALGLLIPLRIKNENGQSPLKVMEHALHPWVIFGVIPLFAFVNAGLSFKGIGLETFSEPITIGIIAGLFLGKPIGVFGLTYLAAMFKLCKLPRNVTWAHFFGLSLISGIGFTMSLFIGTLAFETNDNISAVRLGVLTGSALSAVTGIVILLWVDHYMRKQIKA